MDNIFNNYNYILRHFRNDYNFTYKKINNNEFLAHKPEHIIYHNFYKVINRIISLNSIYVNSQYYTISNTYIDEQLKNKIKKEYCHFLFDNFNNIFDFSIDINESLIILYSRKGTFISNIFEHQFINNWKLYEIYASLTNDIFLMKKILLIQEFINEYY